jgi:signal transduction histidine kinase
LQEHPFDLVALIKEISLMIQSRATEKGLSVAVEAESISVPYVKADVGKLRQILINLLSNAVKFTEDGEVRVGVQHADGQINIYVTDTGIGIPDDQVAKVFDEFTQLDSGSTKRFSGTGLGLSITRHLVQLIGGDIRIRSAEGVGSTFSVGFPVRYTAAAAGGVAAPS